MRIPINLAREPFRRDRPMLIGSAVVAGLLIGLLAFLISVALGQRTQKRETGVALARVNRQIAAVRNDQAKVDAGMRQPGNEVALDRSILLNTLIKLKAISWTRIFSDLDSVCPPNVRVIGIRPTLNNQGGLRLEMQVASDSPEAVIGLVAKLEGSDVFGSTAVSGFTPPSQNSPFYRYQLSVNYVQKL